MAPATAILLRSQWTLDEMFGGTFFDGSSLPASYRPSFETSDPSSKTRSLAITGTIPGGVTIQTPNDLPYHTPGLLTFPNPGINTPTFDAAFKRMTNLPTWEPGALAFYQILRIRGGVSTVLDQYLLWGALEGGATASSTDAIPSPGSEIMVYTLHDGTQVYRQTWSGSVTTAASPMVLGGAVTGQMFAIVGVRTGYLKPTSGGNTNQAFPIPYATDPTATDDLSPQVHNNQARLTFGSTFVGINFNYYICLDYIKV